MAQKREARKIEEQAAEAVRRALPEEFVREMEGDEGARKRRRQEGGFGLEGYEAPDEVWYARSRAAVEGGTGEEGGEERYLIHDALPGEEEEGQGEEQDAGGILGSSTLKALKGYAEKSGGKPVVRQAPVAASGGPLVGYGSDDDSE